MRKPAFEQFHRTTLRSGKPMPQQQREPLRAAIVELLENTGLFLVQKARKDGHDDALIEVHGSWIGTDFSPEAVIEALQSTWPGTLFEGGENQYWIEAEDEIVTLVFAWNPGERGFLTGRVKVTV
jgi:hypothetical protein